MKRFSAVATSAVALCLLASCVDDLPADDEPIEGDVDVDAGTDLGVSYSHPLGDTTYRWPNAEIRYRIDDSLWADRTCDDQDGCPRDRVTDSMTRWTELTRLSFVAVPGCSSDCVVISGNGSSCSSQVGIPSGSQTFMHLPDSANCATSRVIMHELGHVIGLRHEQQRSDRDNHVTFHPENAADTANFAISSSVTEPVGEYDFTSVMHYRAFSHTSTGRMTLTRNDSWGLFDETKRQWRTDSREPVTALFIGDFDGDGFDDAVRHVATGGWQLSHSAQGAWTPLLAPDAPPGQVRVGQFDADPSADLVWASGTSWRYSSGGNSAWLPLLNASTTFATMRVVDHDGDGDSDFFRINGNRFQIALNGRQAFQNQPTVLPVAMTLGELLLGNFVGGAGTDAVYRTPWGISGLLISEGLDGGFVTFRPGAIVPLSDLLAFDKNGDGVNDLLRIKSDPDPNRYHYEYASGGVGAWTPLVDAATDTPSGGVEDFHKVVVGDFNSGRAGEEMLVHGYYTDRGSEPSRTDRGGVAHIYYGQVLLSLAGRDSWQHWDDASQTSNLRQYKVGDFDGDGLDDLFETSTNIAGITSTRYRRMNPDDDHSRVGWRTLTSNVGPASEIAIGNFLDESGESRPRMDVFRKRGSNWEIQSGGVGTWMLMMIDSTPMAQLGFADFDGDGITDIIKSDVGTWKVSWGGKTQFTTLNNSLGTSLSLVRFGDFTGDGRADVVASFSGQWWISAGGTATTWSSLRNDLSDLRTYRFGHFDDDHRLDVFRVNGTTWQISSGATEPWSNIAGNAIMAQSAIPAASLAIGHFHGPGLHDDVIGFLPALGDDNLNGW